MKQIGAFEIPPYSIIEYDELSSTNDYLKAAASDGAADGTVVVALRQTAGRGRHGRSFFSPESGLYMSVLLRRKITADSAHLLTPMAAVAVARALEALGSEPVRIKWVNDIYISGRKVCGILTEAVTAGGGALDYAIIGIGVNIAEPVGGFPEDIREKAGAAFEVPPEDARARLLCETLRQIEDGLLSMENRGFLEEYRRRSILIGRTVCTSVCTGEVVGIDDECRLLVRTSGGVVAVSTGAVE